MISKGSLPRPPWQVPPGPSLLGPRPQALSGNANQKPPGGELLFIEGNAI